MIYFPQLGFNIAIPFDQMGHAAYTGDNGSWEQVFTTENRAYFKDKRMRELDEKLGDIYGLICGEKIIDIRMLQLKTNQSLEREIEIAHEIAQSVLRYEEMLLKSSDLCGELDWYMTFLNQTCGLLTCNIVTWQWLKPQIYTSLCGLKCLRKT